MGQLLSLQGKPGRSFDTRKRSDSHSQRSRRERPYEDRFENDGTSSKESHRESQQSSRAHYQGILQKEVGGNTGPPRRQQKYDRSQNLIGRAHPKGRNYHHVRKRDIHQSTDRVREAKDRNSRSNTSKTGSHHTRSRQTKDCVICADTRSLSHFPDRPPTTECEHENDVCRRCLRTWIQSESASKMWNEVNCPVCAVRMQYDDMREFAPRAVFERYDKLTTRAVYESIPNFRWCITKGCKSGQIHEPGTSRFHCTACRKSHCVEHNAAWHRGETCKEYDYRTNKHLKKQEEAASKKTILETTKKCPGCKLNIEKSFGCDHMSCSRCNSEFCWMCQAPYTKKGVRRVVHRPGCTHYAPDLGYDSD
ncbi:hypothetical protein GQ44DRAFT_694540 [Phaeosphaeriaceae sp. PMI808]|nr:hypothetical protein GQ44DRAFT_694540 [Phaeosphaeriaceae sp. PMI808]